MESFERDQRAHLSFISIIWLGDHSRIKSTNSNNQSCKTSSTLILFREWFSLRIDPEKLFLCFKDFCWFYWKTFWQKCWNSLKPTFVEIKLLKCVMRFFFFYVKVMFNTEKYFLKTTIHSIKFQNKNIELFMQQNIFKSSLFIDFFDI